MGFREEPREVSYSTFVGLFGQHTSKLALLEDHLSNLSGSPEVCKGTLTDAKPVDSGCLDPIEITAIQNLAQPWKTLNILSASEFFFHLPFVDSQKEGTVSQRV